jgi:hypothetical protein
MGLLELGFISIGSLIMGIVVMWIGFYFIARETAFTAVEFGGFITAFFGGAVLEVYITQLDNETKLLFWWYPIGLLIGLLIYHFDPSTKKLRLMTLRIRPIIHS